METNYELKHKCLLVPLRAVVLVLAMLLVGFTTYAQTGKSVRVADNKQLIEALQNPSVGTVVLEAGYYPYLDYQAAEGATVIIKDSGNGNRDDCTYFIIDNDVCFDQPPGTFVQSFAQAGTLPNPSCPLPNTGVWTVSIQPAGSIVQFLAPINEYDMPFQVNQPGSYSLRYTWAAFSTFVETEYFFFGPELITLTAPDVCGLTTEVTFERYSDLVDPQTTVSWTLNGAPYAGPDTSGTFPLTVTECGLYTLCVTVDPSLCPPSTECIVIDFSCEPIADAGPDINVCDELCVDLVGSTGLNQYSEAFTFVWSQEDGPGNGTLTFNPNADSLEVQACIDTLTCEYGEYTVIFDVLNGECSDADTAIIRFYEQPIADAGVVAPLCNDFTFNLAAVPFEYCGVEGTNYWSTAYWELVSYPTGAVVSITDVDLANTGVSITGATGVCLYGDYTFRWVEENSQGVNLGGCEDSDLVTVTIVEDPIPDAGEELVLCNTFEFDLFGVGDAPCNPNTEVTYTWEKTAQPGNCNVVITSGTSLFPHIVISGCDTACEFGKYTFELTQSNDSVCEGTDVVDVWILEDVDADAGPDQHICNNFGFNLTADLTDFCGVAGTNYFTWGTWVLVSGPTAVTIANPAGPATSVTINNTEGCTPYGMYTFRWTEYNGFGTGLEFEGCDDSDDVIIYIYEQPVVLAGTDQEYCDVTTFTLDGTIDTLCTNWETQITWELVSQPGDCDVTFTLANMIDPVVTISNCDTSCSYGDYIFRVTQVNGYYNGGVWDTVCYDTDEVTVSIYEPPVDVNAGPDQEYCDMLTFDLTAVGSDYCSTETNWYSWVLVSQPAGSTCDVTFSDQFGLATVVVIDSCEGTCAYGDYVFRFTEYNGSADVYCSDWDEVTVSVYEPPVDVNAGPDQQLCDDFTFDLTGVGSDYCSTETNWYSWVLVSQPVNAGCEVTFTNQFGPLTGVTIANCDNICNYGEFVFRFTEYNGSTEVNCSDFDDVSIFIFETPVVLAGPDQEYCDVTTFALDGTADALCTNGASQITWELVSQPGECDVTFNLANMIDPVVTISGCDTSCSYGEYIFRVTQVNGYYNNDVWDTVCYDTDEVSVWIYEPPVDVNAGPDQELCDVFTFDLTAVGSDYCSTETNWYSWVLVSQPDSAGCEVTFTNQFGLITGVTVANCDDICNYGEFVFRFTEYNGSADVYCSDWDDVSVFIFETPVALAGLDVNECVDINEAPYCYDMAGTLDYCYSMNGLWTKTCGPGEVVFTDVTDPLSEACFDEPGRYTFTWSVWNGADSCMDEEEVIFDLLEQPVASAELTEILVDCDTLCVDLGLAGVIKYEYFGTDEGECPNYLDIAKWTVLPGAPGTVTFDPADSAPDADICVSEYGGYTLRWTETNINVDGDLICEDFIDIYVEFNETPEPIAVGGEICGNCFTLDGTLDGGFNQDFTWELLPGGNCVNITIEADSLDAEVCIQDLADCYGTYGFVLHQWNGLCMGTDTAWVTFYEMPDPVAICFDNTPNQCPDDYFGDNGNGIDFNYYGCLEPNEVLEVCAYGESNFYLGPWCDCLPGFNWYDPSFYGWTFEWSLIAPTGTSHYSEPGYYDFENGYWNYPYLDVTWGECCDTARIYLTITTDDDCELTLEYKAFVYHQPCVDIVGPDVAEVDMTTEYCNDCPDDSCYLYTWTAEHCGIITSGQGTQCIEVLWTDYNINGGWGEITLTVFDTCTGCCNYDEMPVKIYPAGTLGDATLSGQVLYHNDGETPLNGVTVTLWLGDIELMSTVSGTTMFDGDPPYAIPGYYEFTGLNATTEFRLTATYDAPWYGANATDALGVELRAIEFDPMPILIDSLVEDAMNVNNSETPFISAVDALWIKQRAVNMVNYFPAGNWVFEEVITLALPGVDIYGLNVGDANRSNIPASMKSMPAIDLVNDGTMNVVAGEVFTLPIRIAKANEFGAIQLDLVYNPSLVEVVEVVPVEGMISNITDGNVYIAFSSLNTMILSDNDVVVTLKVKAIGEIAIPESMFSIGINSEFADAQARTIEPVILKSFGITTGPAALDYFLSSNRPNPFSTSTFIEYTMPETGKVKLSVLDMLGQEIAVLVESTQTAGAYTVEFSAAGLATGVYLYKITVDGETRDFISTQRMVVSH